MYKSSELLWGIEIHFKSGDIIFVDNKHLLMMRLTDIKTKLAVTNGELEGVKGKKWQGIKRYKLLRIK